MVPGLERALSERAGLSQTPVKRVGKGKGSSYYIWFIPKTGASKSDSLLFTPLSVHQLCQQLEVSHIVFILNSTQSLEQLSLL